MFAITSSSLLVAVSVSWLVRGIAFCGANTDNQKQAMAAARVSDWKWPSDMHKYAHGKARMKDVVVLGLVVMQRLLGDRRTDYPLVVLCLLANALSGLLIFLIARTFWGLTTAVVIFVLFLTSVWIYQLALYGAAHCVAQAYFLISVYFLQQASVSSFLMGNGWYFLGGAAFGMTLFSSASSRKYVPLFIAMFLYSQRHHITPIWTSAMGFKELYGLPGLGVIGPSILLLAGVVVARVSFKRRLPFPGMRWVYEMSDAAKRQGYAAPDKLQKFAAKGWTLLGNLCFLFAAFLLFCFALSRAPAFYLSLGLTALGALIVVLLFLWPHPIDNLIGYVRYAGLPKTNAHFRYYVEYFAKMGHTISVDMRGAGWAWVIRFLWRIVPVHIVCFGIVTLIQILLISLDPTFSEITATITIYALSLSPILVGEITRGHQEGRAYFPGLVGLLLFIGYMIFRIEHVVPVEWVTIYSLSGVLLLLTSAGWNLYVFFSDVLPSRMAATYLARVLRKLGAKKFYTYGISYNDGFVNVLPGDVIGRYDVESIKKLSQVKTGYVVVPGTSSKVFTMVCDTYAMEHGDFDEDPILNRLLDTRKIWTCSIASFKTFGCSRIWVHENEVTSYQDLILRCITSEDRWRGRAWIIDAGKLHSDGWIPASTASVPASALS